MMLWYLLKKDILIIKKHVLIMLAAAVLIPPFMLWRVPEYAGILGFMLSVIFCVLILLQYISLKEYQFPKAEVSQKETKYRPVQRQSLCYAQQLFHEK